MDELAFIKMEGAGNDYVYVDAINHQFDLDRGSAIARSISDRHRGIGADGLIVLAPSSSADVRMVMWNSDGSRGSMCGNGVRCLAKMAYDLKVVDSENLRVETDSGICAVELLFADTGEVSGARVDMGAVEVRTEPGSFTACDRQWSYYAADVGNPHAVIFVDEDLTDLPVAEVGRAAQALPVFSDGVNVEFVRIDPDGVLHQRTFERGSGETLACGSGATAAACVAVRLGFVRGAEVLVRLLGGDLVIASRGSHAVMEGPARTVFSGRIPLPIT